MEREKKESFVRMKLVYTVSLFPTPINLGNRDMKH
jgi:hypothetical protein